MEWLNSMNQVLETSGATRQSLQDLAMAQKQVDE